MRPIPVIGDPERYIDSAFVDSAFIELKSCDLSGLVPLESL